MNKLQKRALRKKRHERQQYLKYQAPLDRLEAALLNLNPVRCSSTKDGVRCTRNEGHAEAAHQGLNTNGLPVFWRDVLGTT